MNASQMLLQRASGDLYHPNLRSPSSLGQGNDFYKGKQEPVMWLSASFDQVGLSFWGS
jgi:hypothetical protein